MCDLSLLLQTLRARHPVRTTLTLHALHLVRAKLTLRALRLVCAKLTRGVRFPGRATTTVQIARAQGWR